jgi:hypothetical protein
MRVGSLNELEPAEARALVVNVHTELWTTRALLSALALAGMPVLVLDCDPSDESQQHFDGLMRSFSFDVLDAPLRRHGDTLDWMFTHTRDEQLLLLDSDAELLDGELVGWMRSMLRDPRVFGAGFVEGPFWMTKEWLAPRESLLYMERPWVPCVLLRVDAARRALQAGRHFAEQLIPNEVARSPRLSRLLAARFPQPWGTRGTGFDRLPDGLRRRISTWSLDGLRFARREYQGFRPKMACYDTASLVYEYLKVDEGLLFAGIDVELSANRVHHYGGITRSAVFGAMPLDTLQSDVDAEVRDRLATHYGYVWER